VTRCEWVSLSCGSNREILSTASSVVAGDTRTAGDRKTSKTCAMVSRRM